MKLKIYFLTVLLLSPLTSFAQTASEETLTFIEAIKKGSCEARLEKLLDINEDYSRLSNAATHRLESNSSDKVGIKYFELADKKYEKMRALVDLIKTDCLKSQKP